MPAPTGYMTIGLRKLFLLYCINTLALFCPFVTWLTISLTTLRTFCLKSNVINAKLFSYLGKVFCYLLTIFKSPILVPIIYSREYRPMASIPRIFHSKRGGGTSKTDRIMIRCGSDAKSRRGIGIFFSMYSHTTSMLYFS
jgi:hypothetical protein